MSRNLVCVLKSLHIAYDHTVRDECNTIVQLFFGEAGLDIVQRKPRAQSHGNQYRAFHSSIRHLLPKEDTHMWLIEPGTPVGLLCAHNIAEKIVQGNLSTFHKAGSKNSSGRGGEIENILSISKKRLLRTKVIIYFSDTLTLSDVKTNINLPLYSSIPINDIMVHMGGDLYKLNHETLFVYRITRAHLLSKTNAYAVSEDYLYGNINIDALTQEDKYDWYFVGGEWCVEIDTDKPLRVYASVKNYTRIECTNFHFLETTFGIEYARETLYSKLHTLMDNVCPSFIDLLVDFMSHTGEIKALNRYSTRSSNREFFSKAAHEESFRHFLDAGLHGKVDNLKNPNSSLAFMVQERLGTGVFDLIGKIDLQPCT